MGEAKNRDNVLVGFILGIVCNGLSLGVFLAIFYFTDEYEWTNFGNDHFSPASTYCLINLPILFGFQIYTKQYKQLLGSIYGVISMSPSWMLSGAMIS